MNHPTHYPQEYLVRPNEWLGCGSPKPIQKWTKPITVAEVAEDISVLRPEGIHFHEDWLAAGGESSIPIRKWQKPKVI